ncbi:hypothetical protein F4Y59_07150 [Candidatus Poribacteria bacterium]|nr:hypothetical protein [Candidatus Poribacteria bacterium]MXY27919.1 hypothetical protein [Candidatus Poribacteria bacterium]MYK18256.1 hypothetical protein [Candidatus Poribacteria bacterium]
MLLSDWYARWKEKHIQAAVEAARKHAYEEGYEAGKAGVSENVQGVKKNNAVTRESNVVLHEHKAAVVTPKKKETK